ncbi:glycerophosphodiester phosphodiesterase [Niastella caeni]|uniref:Glycerophosphodiester phosphodiesterase n=1 Tax=Niastella caeni TaxID=2569763 RepID=A0A4V4H1C8_9BACT|nr:glycerophosphodiester phosphodiesterase [Niastella caeni]THU39906.1 glycerophosphodiester phosphodiesterase [Niastella caeni]
MIKFREVTELLLLVALIFACHASKKVSDPLLPAFDIEGHRGCRGLMPENTIPAMMKALELGVTTLEMDAVITKDKQVILSHEPFFNHEITTGPDGKYITEQDERKLNIYHMTYAQTQAYDVGLKPHPRFPNQRRLKATKPLLREVIDNVEAYHKLNGGRSVFYNIETKCQPATDNNYHPAPEEFVNTLMKVVNGARISNRVIIQSFDFRTLQALHKKYPIIKTAALIEDYDKRPLEEHLKALGFMPTIYSPAYSLVTKELVEKCHERLIKVIPWTVNDKAGIDKLKALGVDGIITDYPDLLK